MTTLLSRSLLRLAPVRASSSARRYSTGTPRKEAVRIGGASAFWGDSAMAAPQLLAGAQKLDYLVFDYLAETTLAIMARMREKKPDLGYATDFVAITMKQIAKQVKADGVKVISNAGGMNPLACKTAIEQVLAAQGVDLKVGVVLGDDLVGRADQLRESGVADMFTGRAFPADVKSVNAYLGARPIAQLLDEGCDIVLTGRVVDSAVTLGACMHEFGWSDDDYDKLAGATVAGHIIECGAQATGGLYTDWEACDSWVNIGYPVAEVEPDGSFTVTKNEGTDGVLSVGGVAEQLLYEVGDPGAYHVPDVACDMTSVSIVQTAPDRVRVSDVRGLPPTSTYKTTVTYFDGFRNEAVLVVAGIDADKKARRTGETILARTSAMLKRLGLGDYTETSVEVIGAEDMFGANRSISSAREVVLKMSAKHPEKKALELLAREFAPAATSMAPGTMALVPGRPTPSPLVSVFSCLLPKADVPVSIVIGDSAPQPVVIASSGGFVASASESLPPADSPTGGTAGGATERVLLERLVFARSGDKGDTANVGVIARRPECAAARIVATYVPFLRELLTEERLADWYAHAVKGDVRRYELPGIGGFNFVMTGALGGGGTMSLRTDSLAKGFAQQLLVMEVDVPAEWVA